MRSSFTIAFGVVVAAALLACIFGLFGILPAIAALSLFAAIGCLLTVRTYEGAMEPLAASRCDACNAISPHQEVT